MMFLKNDNEIDIVKRGFRVLNVDKHHLARRVQFMQQQLEDLTNVLNEERSYTRELLAKNASLIERVVQLETENIKLKSIRKLPDSIVSNMFNFNPTFIEISESDNSAYDNSDYQSDTSVPETVMGHESDMETE